MEKIEKLPMEEILNLANKLEETYEKENNSVRKMWINNEIRKNSEMFGMKMASWVGL